MLHRFIAAIGLATLLVWPPGAAEAQKASNRAVAAAELPDCAAGLPAGAERAECVCAEGAGGGSVWGSGPYTADSDICAAARHAGALGAGGGTVTLIRRPGQQGYEASTRNGVTTGAWGSYGESFDVVGGAGVRAAPDFCGTMPADAERLTCRCAPDRPPAAVWGSGPYTADSDICTAARHAGLIDAAGGDLQVLRIGGLSRYRGSVAHGVETDEWGGYDSSIVFDRN